MSFQISQDVAEFYGLADTSYVKTSPHLCMMCDLFFKQAKHVRFPLHYDREVIDGRAPQLSERLLAARSDDRKSMYPHWWSVEPLKEASEHKCHICRLFWSQLTQSERDWLTHLDRETRLVFRITLDLRIVFYSPSTPLHYRIGLMCAARYVTPGGSPRKVHSFFHDLVLLPTQRKNCVSEPWLERNRLSSAIPVSISWIRDCMETHTYCKDTATKPSGQPRRLIMVGKDDNELRLCEGLNPTPLYFTLSHCWGPIGITFKLSNENRISLCEQIPLSQLSLTFQDAIDFTRKLAPSTGVEHLWIDALCIIQDSEDDWSHESAIMGDIYAGGVCNLAACSGPDGTTGLFPMNDTWLSHNCVVEAGPASCLEGFFNVYNAQMICDSERDIVRDELIMSRSWCVQELNLSKRVLYFAKHHIMWDCSTLVAREQEPQLLLDDELSKFPDRKRSIQVSQSLHKYDEQCLKRGIEPSVLLGYQRWVRILGEYTHCSLTRHTDKLAAISGLAKAMHAVLGPDEEYVAGLWTRYLHLQLLWEVSSDNVNFRYREWRAPSWSWASAEGGCYSSFSNGEGILDSTSLIQASISHQVATFDPYGAVTSAVLHIEGSLIKVRLNSRLEAIWSGDVVTSATVGTDLNFQRGSRFACRLDFTFPGHDPIDEYCLLVIEKILAGKKQLGGIILMRQEDTGGQYIRIGLAWILPIELLEKAHSERLKNEDDYETALGNGDYRISII